MVDPHENTPEQAAQNAEFFDDAAVERMDFLQEAIKGQLETILGNPAIIWKPETQIQFENDEFVAGDFKASLSKNIDIEINAGVDPKNKHASPGSISLYVYDPNGANKQTPSGRMCEYTADITKRGTVQKVNVIVDTQFTQAGLDKPASKQIGTYGYLEHYEQMHELLGMIVGQVLPGGDDDPVIAWADAKLPADRYRPISVEQFRAAYEIQADSTITLEDGRPIVSFGSGGQNTDNYNVAILPAMETLVGEDVYKILPKSVHFMTDKRPQSSEDYEITVEGAENLQPGIIGNQAITSGKLTTLDDNKYGTNYTRTMKAMTELYFGLAATTSPEKAAGFCREWAASYCRAEAVQTTETELQPLNMQQAFEYIRNQRVIAARIEEMVLTRNFERSQQETEYTYTLPEHDRKKIVVTSSNYYDQAIDWQDDRSSGSIKISHYDRLIGKVSTIDLTVGVGDAILASEDQSAFEVGETLRDVIQTILGQDETYPALTQDIRQHLDEVDSTLLFKLASGDIDGNALGHAVAAIRYFLGRSGVQPIRKQERTVWLPDRGDAPRNISVIDLSIMTKQGGGSTLGLNRVTILSEGSDDTDTTARVLLTDTNRGIVESHAIEGNAHYNLLGDLGLSAASDIASLRSRIEDLGSHKESLVDSATFLRDCEVAIQSAPHAASDVAPVVYKRLEDQNEAK